jgi:hypothetical protein
VAFQRAGAAEDADLAHVAVGGEDSQRVAQLLQRLVDQLDVAAVGLIAQKLECVGDDFTDHVAVGNPGELFDQPIRRALDFRQIRATENMGGFGRLLGLFDIFISV